MNVLKALGTPFTALAGKANHAIEMKILMSVARHAATALGGLLVANGYLEMSHTAEFVGALMTLVGMFSGAAQKVEDAK